MGHYATPSRVILPGHFPGAMQHLVVGRFLLIITLPLILFDASPSTAEPAHTPLRQ